jgi:Tripartite tricarboxylate transporter TctB family
MQLALTIRNPKDFWTGIIYVGVGVAAFLIAREYAFGSAGRMGPGYFPSVVSSLLVVVGAVTIIRSFLQDGERISGLVWKPTILVLGSVIAFGLLINRAGLVVAAAVLVLMSAAASEKFRFEWMAALGLIALIAFCSIVFVTGLGVPMPLVGSWFAF